MHYQFWSETAVSEVDGTAMTCNIIDYYQLVTALLEYFIIDSFQLYYGSESAN